jgi:hypothetical protein
VLPDDSDNSQSVVNERSVHEPDEFDPDSLGPSVPEAPSPPNPSGKGASSEVAGLFWVLVLVFNVALLGLALGPMLAYFEGWVDLGIQIFLGGLVLFAYGSYRYVKFTRNRDDDDADEEADESTDHNG